MKAIFRYVTIFCLITFFGCSLVDDFFDDWDPNFRIFSVRVDITNEPIEGASIYLEYISASENKSKSVTLVTGRNGGVNFRDVEELTYVKASAEGYETKIFNDGMNSYPIRLTPIIN